MVHAVRDPYGLRPLCLGRLGTADAPEGWMVASESPALDLVGAAFVREIAPGEMVDDHADGRHARPSCSSAPARRSELCIFEFVYFARPDAYLLGHQVHSTRRRMGEQLADQSPVEADLVMGVPDSGVPAAEGFAKRSGIPFGYGLVKNRYIGRTFIAPDQDAARGRACGASSTRCARTSPASAWSSSTTRSCAARRPARWCAMLRDAGATEVHLRISSPPFSWPCYYGIDTPTREELLAANHTVEEMRAYIGSDSLEFISLDNLRAAIGLDGECCDACLTGDYPAPVPVALGRAGGRW